MNMQQVSAYDTESGPHIRVRVDGISGTIVLDRHERRNALSRRMVHDLIEAFQDLHQQRSLRAVILTGAKTTFCAGTDLEQLRPDDDLRQQQAEWFDDVRRYQELLETMLRFPKPIIAAVNGSAVGSGAGLILAADMAIASPQARFGFPEPRRGLVAGTVAPLLAFRIGGSRAASLLLRSELIEAQQALQLGVYDQLVEHDKLWARARQLTDELAAGAPEALAMTKRILNETVGEQLLTMLSVGAAVTASARTTEVAREGILAFLEKRSPQWP